MVAEPVWCVVSKTGMQGNMVWTHIELQVDVRPKRMRDVLRVHQRCLQIQRVARRHRPSRRLPHGSRRDSRVGLFEESCWVRIASNYGRRGRPHVSTRLAPMHCLVSAIIKTAGGPWVRPCCRATCRTASAATHIRHRNNMKFVKLIWKCYVKAAACL